MLAYTAPESRLGSGKTALAKLISYIATLKDTKLHNLDLLTAYYPVEKDQPLSSVLQESLNKLTNNIDANVLDKIGKRLGKLFENGKFSIGAFGVSVGIETKAEEKTKEITIKDQTVSILANLIKALNEDAVSAKDGILIIIDEIHNLHNIEGAASVFRNVITSLDFENLGKVSFLIIGYKEDMERFFSEDPSARRTFDIKQLSVMPKNEAMDLIKKGFKEADIKWDEKALSRNIDASGGYPHSIQILGHNLVEKDTDNFIDEEDWTNVIFETALELQDKDFSTMYTFKKPHTEKDKVLAELAQTTEPLTKKELMGKTNGKNIYRCLAELKKKGAIWEDEQEGKIYLHSQLLRTAILLDLAVRRILSRNTAK